MQGIKHLDIQIQDGDKLVACIQYVNGGRSVCYSELGNEDFINFFWNQIQVENAKGSFTKQGEWR